MAQGYTQPTLARPRDGKLPEAVVFSDSTSRAFGRFPFGGFETEKETMTRTPKQETNQRTGQRLQVILDAWERFRHTSEHLLKPETIDLERVYGNALVAVVRIGCTPGELEAFSITLPELTDIVKFPVAAGIFVSALINIGDGTRYVMHTNAIEGRIAFVGYRSTKEIIVVGDVGCSAGAHMEGGKLVVTGNTSEFAGEQMMWGEIVIEQCAGFGTGCGMKNGKLTIMGNAGPFLGQWMEGGTIVVMGRTDINTGDAMKGGEIIIHEGTGNYVGSGMTNGVIRINGNCGGIDYRRHGGKIFVGGEQVYPRKRLK